jgi:hypothetical protein
MIEPDACVGVGHFTMVSPVARLAASGTG